MEPAHVAVAVYVSVKIQQFVLYTIVVVLKHVMMFIIPPRLSLSVKAFHLKRKI